MEVRGSGFVALCFIVSLGCGGDSGPAWEWAVQTPAELGMDSAVLEGARDYAFADGKNTQGVVIIRHGAVPQAAIQDALRS